MLDSGQPKRSSGGATQDLRKGGPLEMFIIVKLIKIKVLLHQFSNLMFNLHYMYLLNQNSNKKYTNKFHS